MERIFHQVHVRVIYFSDRDLDTRDIANYRKVEKDRFSRFVNEFKEEIDNGIISSISRVDNTGAFDYFDKVLRSCVILDIYDWNKDEIKYEIRNRIGSLDVVKEISGIVSLPGIINN